MTATVVAGASAETVVLPKPVTVDWVERVQTFDNFGYETGPKMTFRVRSVRFAPGGWSANVSIRNDEAKPIDFRPDGTALVTFASKRKAGTGERFPADTFKPPPPRRLGAGKTWTGVMSGADLPRPGMYLRIAFGSFNLDGGIVGGWTTNGVVRLQAK
jgi:hypothetical protein